MDRSRKATLLRWSMVTLGGLEATYGLIQGDLVYVGLGVLFAGIGFVGIKEEPQQSAS